MTTFAMHRSNRGLVAVGMACTLGLMGHGAPGRTSSLDALAAPTERALDACALLTDAEAHAVAPSTGHGRPGTVKMKGVSTCEWHKKNGLPALILTVTPAGSSGVQEELQEQLGPTGYAISAVPHLGDEAAVAVQQPNPKYGIKAGVAILSVRVGQRELSLSPTGVTIAGTGTPEFAKLVHAAALAVKRLEAAGG